MSVNDVTGVGMVRYVAVTRVVIVRAVAVAGTGTGVVMTRDMVVALVVMAREMAEAGGQSGGWPGWWLRWEGQGYGCSLGG